MESKVWQMVLSTKQTDHGQREETYGSQGRGGKEWDKQGVWGFWMQTVKFGTDGQWSPTAQHKELCVHGSFCRTTEIEESL